MACFWMLPKFENVVVPGCLTPWVLNGDLTSRFQQESNMGDSVPVNQTDIIDQDPEEVFEILEVIGQG